MKVIYFKIFRSNKVDYNPVKVIQNYEKKELPLLPLRAITLMTKYNIPEGKLLGIKLKKIEEKLYLWKVPLLMLLPFKMYMIMI